MHTIITVLICFVVVVSSCGQSFNQFGLASFYAAKFEGRTTANGEKYIYSKLTAAHKTLPFSTILKVKNLENGHEVIVRVNDRGSYVKGRIIDLSKSAAKELDFINKGIIKVEIASIGNSAAQRKTSGKLDKPAEVISAVANKYYSLSVNEQKLSDFGFQIGSYRELVNLVQLAAELQKTYNDRIFIQVSEFQEVNNYKIIVGSLRNKQKAEKLNDDLKQSYLGSFVIKF